MLLDDDLNCCCCCICWPEEFELNCMPEFILDPPGGPILFWDCCCCCWKFELIGLLLEKLFMLLLFEDIIPLDPDMPRPLPSPIAFIIALPPEEFGMRRFWLD